MELSVVIVAKNEEKNIARCIESVFKHITNVDSVEVLLADSSSTDRTISIASKFPIKIISLRPEWLVSPAAGRFSGVNNVSGNFVLIIDGDMELLPGWIEKALLFMKNHTNVASVVGRHYDVWETSDKLNRNISRESRLGTEILKINYVFCSSIFRRAYLLDVGNFQPYLRAEEEAEISYRFVHRGYDLYYLPVDSINHYSIPRNTFAETKRRMQKNLWAGMGDMFSWCLSKRYYAILWQRFKVCLYLSFLVILILFGFLLSFFTNDERWVKGSIILFGFFIISLCIKKGSLYQGILSVINIFCITWSLWSGLKRKILSIEEYPRDVIWIKN